MLNLVIMRSILTIKRIMDIVGSFVPMKCMLTKRSEKRTKRVKEDFMFLSLISRCMDGAYILCIGIYKEKNRK